MDNELNLKYEVKLPNDGSHDQGVSIKTKTQGNLVNHLVINPEDNRFFQRTKVFDNGFVFVEETWSDYRIMRFSHPFERENDMLIFDV